jgi:membrane protein YdbS with pleckstrin-like domain
VVRFETDAEGDNVRVNTAASPIYRVLGLLGAVATGVGLWRFTSRDWIGGIVCAVIVAAVAAVYVLGQRRVGGSGGGRRY